MDEPNTTTTKDNAAAAPTSQSQSITHQPNLPLILAVATLLIMLLVGILMLTGFGRAPVPVVEITPSAPAANPTYERLDAARAEGPGGSLDSDTASRLEASRQTDTSAAASDESDVTE